MTDPDYFSLAEFRLLPDMGSPGVYSDTKVLAAAAYFTAIVEREVCLSFIPRTITEELDGDCSGALVLSRANVLSLTSVTADGVSLTTSLFTTRNGVLRYKVAGGGFGALSRFLRGVANVTVVYSAGYSACPADVKDAVMWATRDRLLSQQDQNGIDIRRTSMTNDYGTTSYVLPGENRPTGYPDLDAVIASYVRTASPLGFG